MSRCVFLVFVEANEYKKINYQKNLNLKNAKNFLQKMLKNKNQWQKKPTNKFKKYFLEKINHQKILNFKNVKIFLQKILKNKNQWQKNPTN